MWYNKFSWTCLAFIALIALVKGSCLDYGHSCWGAHGKRSGMVKATSNALRDAQKQPTENYADNLTEQLLNNNNNNDENNNNVDSEAGNNAENTNAQDGNLAQLWRQHHYQLRLQQRGNKPDEVHHMVDDGALESWRRVELSEQRRALRKALMLQQLADQRQLQQQQQQLQATGGSGQNPSLLDLYELKK